MAPTMTEHNAANRFDELDPAVKDMLRKLEPEEVETLKYMSTIPKAEFRAMMRFVRDIKAAAWYFRWGAASIIAVFLTSMMVAENVMKAFAWFKGGPHP
jgi:hypothetical protein